MPKTYKTYLIGALALAGIPPLAGFFSKDEIVLVAFKTPHMHWLAVVLLLGALMTAFYTTRMVVLTFFGEYRGQGHPHESPATMTGPLIALAGATIFVGFLGFAPLGAPFLDWVYFGTPETPEFNPWVALISVSIALIGVFLGWRAYSKYRERDPIQALGPFYNVLEHKYYLDDFYLKGIVRPIQYRISAGVNWFNTYVLDGVVNGAAWVKRVTLAGLVSWFDRRVIDGAVNGVGEVTGETGGLLKYLQSGNVQRYAIFLFGGVLLLALLIVNVK
jgi:NADH-quinone oxidoreductase subunit L